MTVTAVTCHRHRGTDGSVLLSPSFFIRAKDDTVWMRMKEKGNKGAGRTGPDDGIGAEWSKINVK